MNIAEELNDKIYQIQEKCVNGELTPEEADKKCIALINQFKREIVQDAWFAGFQQGVITDHNDRDETNNKRMSFEKYLKSNS